uniref:Uncharacterized protein n=1 Tax=Strongyloides venezuelensis TaxID=75913 RepID=A0A0K0G5W3_STRVS
MNYLNFTIIFIVILNATLSCFGFRFQCHKVKEINNIGCSLEMTPWEYHYRKYFEKILPMVDYLWIRETAKMGKKDFRFFKVINSYLKISIQQSYLKRFCRKINVPYVYPTYFKLHVRAQHYASNQKRTNKVTK